MKVRISDIAERAQVSTATVSLVLNNKSGVSDEMRKKILLIAKEMNYKGKITSTKHSLSFLKIANEKQKSIYQHAYSSYIDEIIEGLSAEARGAGYNINMAYFQDFPDDIEALFPESEGFIFLGSDFQLQDVSIIKAIEKPVILLDSSIPHVHCSQVGVDNTDAMFQMLNHLKHKGHEKIGYISSDYGSYDHIERKLAFSQCMEELHFSLNKRFLLSLNPLESDNTHRFSHFSKETMPDAFICCDDSIALKAYQTLVRLGFRISEDVALAGFGHLPEGRFIHPPLTTFQFPQKQMGKIAFSILQQHIEQDQDSIPTIRYKVQGKLIDRLSAMA